MNSYLIIKYCHVTFALLSASGFALRAYWMLFDSAYLQTRAVRVLPHVNDTLLLVSAIVLVLMSRQYPLVVGWVTLKIGLLLLYIGFGTMALKRGKTRQSRIGFLIAALAVLGAIFGVAVFKPAW